MDYQLARDREQHLAYELFRYREDSNEAAFVVVAVDKIYAYESLTFNDTVACEVISRWKVGLKEDMDVWSDVYVLSNNGIVFSCGCKAEIWVTKGLLVKAKENILGLEIIRNQSVGSQEYQVVCTRPDIASTDADMLDGFDRGLQTNVQVFVDLDYTMGRSITVMSRSITWIYDVYWGLEEGNMDKGTLNKVRI
ncbi:hypothetical protein Tco_0723188 [Tanacetum coccineum]